MDNKQAILNFIGIARRASKIVSGQDKLLSEIRNGKVHFLFIASDTGQATQKNLQISLITIMSPSIPCTLKQC